MPIGIPLTRLDEDKIISVYLSGASALKTSQQTGYSNRKIVEKVLKRRGIPTRPKGYPIDDSFFEEINTPEKAYWLGWLMSDGCNNVPVGRVQIILKQSDKDVLEKLKKYIKYEGPIYLCKSSKTSYSLNSKTCTLAFTNKKLSKDLEKHGCVQRKTYRLTFPSIPDSLLSHFARGYIEGDGTFGFKKNKTFFFGVLGNGSFIEGLAQAIKGHLNIECPVYLSSKESPWMRTINKTARLEVMALLDWIYIDCGDMYLERKYSRYLKLKEIHKTLPLPSKCKPVGGDQWKRRNNKNT